jgi:uncharacterized membrane protein
MSIEQTPAPRATTFPYADRVNVVFVDDTFRWLAAGWRDFRRSGLTSFAYGLVFVIAGVVLTVGAYLAGFEYLIAPLLAGFMLVGPLLTVGLYAISRDLESNQKPKLSRALMAWRSNPVHLLGMGLGLVLFLIIWIRLAVLTFAVSFPYKTMDLQSIVNAAFFTTDGIIFLIVGTMIGCVMAAIAFAVSVFSLPLMLDRKVDIIQALATSVVAVIMNVKVMAVWAVLIVIFTVAGLVTFYIGLAITLPLIGHASWHAYRTVIKPLPQVKQ